MSETIRFTVPLPPVSLRKNSRAHWGRKKKDADEYSEDVNYTYIQQTVADRDRGQGLPWERARVTYIWRYAGVAPDHSNLGGNTAYLQDILAMAPKLSPEQSAKYRRWHLGIIENDRGIEAVFKMEKVNHKADECVVVEIEAI